MADKLASKGWNWAPIPAELILDKKLNDLDVRVYGYLLWRCGRKGHTWPGEERIAKDLDKSTVTISRSISRLKSEGWIERKRRRNSSAITYVLERKSGLVKNDKSRLIKNDTSGFIKNDTTELESIKESQIEKNLARQPRAPRALTPLQEEQRKLESLFSELSGRPIPPIPSAAKIWHITTAAWVKAANGQSESVMRAAYAAHTHDGLSIKGPQSIDYKFHELLNPAPKHEMREL